MQYDEAVRVGTVTIGNGMWSGMSGMQRGMHGREGEEVSGAHLPTPQTRTPPSSRHEEADTQGTIKKKRLDACLGWSRLGNDACPVSSHAWESRESVEDR